MKNNQRKAIKKKQRKKELLERQRDEELYRLSRIEKDTWEGQTTLPITELNNHKKTKDNWSFLNYLGFNYK